MRRRRFVCRGHERFVCVMPLVVAFAVSLTAHLAILLLPGWSLPLSDEGAPMILTATLTPAPTVVPTPVPAPVNAQPPAKKPKPVAPVASPPPEVPAAPPQPSREEGPADAVPPAPTATEANAPETAPPPAAEKNEAQASAAEIAARLPRRAELVFSVMRNGLLIGETRHRWESDGERYRLRVTTRTTGLAALFHPLAIEQESEGILSAEGLQPLAYRHRRDGRLREEIVFRPQEGRIDLSGGRDVVFLPSQDLVSWFYQLALLPERPLLLMMVANARRLSQYAIEHGDAARVETGLGEKEALPFRVGGAPDADATEVWLDRETKLPLLIRHRDRKGDLYEQRLSALALDAPAAEASAHRRGE